MNEIIYPRSPREVMDGWVHLPRFVDKVRLHLAGRLHPDYQPNFTKGFDGWWLEAAGVTAEVFIEVVRGSMIDGQICDWVHKNVRTSPEDKAAFGEKLLSYGKVGDEKVVSRFNARKLQAGFGDREEVQCFVDLIEADERRM